MSKTRMLNVPVSELMLMKEGNRRVVNTSQLERMQREWDPSLIGVLHVAAKNGDGKYAIIDGQHRFTVMKGLGWSNQRVACIIHENAKDLSDKARLFVGFNDRIAVRPIDRFLNQLAAGEDRAVAINAVLRRVGLRVDHYSANGTVTAVTALEKVLDDLGEKGLERVLTISTTAWGVTPGAVKSEVIRGLGLFLRRYGSEVDNTDVAAKIRTIPGGPDNLIARARSSRDIHGSSLPQNVAAVITATYNKGRRNKSLASWWSR